MISHLGAMLPVADGMALAFQLKGESRVAAVFSGDGGTSEGDFHEAANLAAVWKLPVIFVIENNQYGLSTPVTEQYACARLSDRGVGYGMAAETVDGNDVVAVVEAVGRAAERGRAGEGPTLLEFMTFRMRGHEEASGVAYVPAHLFEEWAARDPIARFEQALLDQGVLTDADRDAVRAAFKEHIDQIADEAYAAPEPESTAEGELSDVYAPPSDDHNHDDTMTRRHDGVSSDPPAASNASRAHGAEGAVPPLSAKREAPTSWSGVTSMRSPMAFARPCVATLASSSWVRTSRNTAGRSRSPKDSSRSSASHACATRRSSSPAP